MCFKTAPKSRSKIVSHPPAINFCSCVAAARSSRRPRRNKTKQPRRNKTKQAQLSRFLLLQSEFCIVAIAMSRPGGGDEALRSFMHQLGMMEGMFGHGPARDSFSKIAERLQPSVPPHEKISALNELSEAFLMGTEISLRGFDSASFASLVVPCLDTSAGNAVVNSALLAIFNIMETIPQHMPAFVNGGCIRAVIAVLENVEFIDTHEQAVSVLTKLAPDYSADIASAGGLSALLSYLDFFDAATQRSLANIASQLGKAVAASSPPSRPQFLPQFMQVLPVLTSMMTSSMTQLHSAGHLCMATLLMCISDATSRDSLQSFIGAGALSLLLHSVAAHFYVVPASPEQRDRLPSGGPPPTALPASSGLPAEPASSRRDSLGVSAGGSGRLPDSLVQAILLALQHVATIKDGQQLLLANSIGSVLADFFLGHGFSQGARLSPSLHDVTHSLLFRRRGIVQLRAQHHQPALSRSHSQHVHVFVIPAATHRCETSNLALRCSLSLVACSLSTSASFARHIDAYCGRHLR
jgi:hypothetical protein